MTINKDSFINTKTKCCNKKLIHNLSEFLEYIEYIKNSWGRSSELWYRGVSKSKYELRPSIFRANLRYKPKIKDQDQILNEFIRRAKNLYDGNHENYNIWDWYVVMQHYGLLLDY